MPLLKGPPKCYNRCTVSYIWYFNWKIKYWLIEDVRKRAAYFSPFTWKRFNNIYYVYNAELIVCIFQSSRKQMRVFVDIVIKRERKVSQHFRQLVVPFFFFVEKCEYSTRIYLSFVFQRESNEIYDKPLNANNIVDRNEIILRLRISSVEYCSFF